LSSVVHFCPDHPTYWRSSSHMSHRAGGAVLGGY
jgi:hypothetical protein